MSIGSVLIISVILGFCNAQLSSDCENKETCEECIQQIACAWCIRPNNSTQDKKPVVHCRLKNESSAWCSDDMLESPESSKVILKDEQFSNDTINPTQLRPQRVKLSLRRGEKYELKFKYKVAANYPVDLYYIMDLSNSMEKHKMELAQLGKKLAETMRNITTNFKLGFGSFIDKVELPFTSTSPKYLATPCEGCRSAYSFKNHMPLTDDYQRFVEKVKASQVSGNLDTPEGGLDAIMQAIVCKEKIKWREQARHLLILSTDADFHIAGDGKLAGILEPNNGTCYTDDKDFIKYDYPSISHINHVATENNINIIFAILKKGAQSVVKSYEELSKNIKNSNCGEFNTNDGNSIIKLIVDNYYQISETLRFTSDADSTTDVTFSSKCKGTTDILSDTCSDVHVDDVLEFTATIHPRECPPGGEKKVLSIRPDGLSDILQVELEVICECSCSSPNHTSFSSKSDECSQSGDLRCGVCSCSKGRFGRNCQCDSSQSSSEDVSNCIMTGSNEICSGLGQCRCGKCECSTTTTSSDPSRLVYGKFCQCDNQSCKRGEGGLPCSGRGECDCGACACRAGYAGDACQCALSSAACVAPGSPAGVECSGRGKCVCGRCECRMDDNRYSGTFCEDCVSCPAQRCEEFRNCVECQAYNSGIYDNATCIAKCTSFVTQIVDSFDAEQNSETKKCRIPDNERCIIDFEYHYDKDKKLVVRALKEKMCAHPPNVLAWIVGVIGTILIAGLVLLIVWKMCTTIHDRREYARFVNEQKSLKWSANSNPLYRDAITNFRNPVFKRSSVRMSNIKGNQEQCE